MLNNNSTSSQKEELLQAIINDMKQQGFLDDFTDEETGEALLEIQFSDETVVCKVEKTNGEDSQE
jgi:ribosomal protein S8